MLTGLFKPSLVVLLALAATVLGISSGLAQAPKEIRVGYQKAGIFPAVKQRGTVEDALRGQGISVRWVEFQFGPPLLEALNTGSLDFGYTGDAPPVFAQAAAANLLYVAALPAAGANEAIIVAEASPIRSVADLKGKRIAVAKGSSAHNTLVAVLDKAGLAYSDVVPVYLAPADAAAAFSSGRVDAWCIWDPYLALAQNASVRVVALARDAHDSNAFFLANKEFVAGHPDLVARLNAIFAAESNWADAHRQEVAASLHAATGIDSVAIARAVARSQFLVVPLSDAIVTSQQATADRFFRLGLIPKPVAVRDIVWRWVPEQ
jgi:sulfonate transport system substrate-binding protein